MKIVDRVLSWVLILGGLMHAVGSAIGYRHEPMTLLWAISATEFVLMVGALNLLRAGRPDDKPVAWIAFAGSVAWAAGAVVFGRLIGNLLDPRALIHGLASAGLALFSLRTLRGAAR